MRATLPCVTARLLADGSCVFVDDFEGATVSWPSATALAEAWLEEWRHEAFGRACDFINEMTRRAAPGVLDLLRVFAECATTDELDWIGAGPLEDLLSHSGNGAVVLEGVEKLARSHDAIALALRNVWLGDTVAPEIRSRLVALGARDLSRP